MIFKKEEEEDRKDLEESYETYHLIVEKFGCYVAGAEKSIEKGGISPEDLHQKSVYGNEVLTKLRELDNIVKQRHVMIKGDTEVLLAAHVSYLKRLEDVGARATAVNLQENEVPAAKRRITSESSLRQR